jgi:2-polyprenyl-3-methyl-5-hydroxy-6-metoxy-1,4-benzoquinol methylase
MDRRAHWENVFETKDTQKVSWYRSIPKTSMDLIRKHAESKSDTILDMGGGDSNLPDFLIKENYSNVMVADISSAALGASQKRMGKQAEVIKWMNTDVLDMRLENLLNVWHDRAVFHFLNATEDQVKYVKVAAESIKPGGILLLATFALDGGPLKCSGLEVARHDSDSIKRLFGPVFDLLESFYELHTTPSGSEQKFVWFVLKKS